MEFWARAWRTLLRGWPALVAFPVLGALLGGILASRIPPAYQVQVRLYPREIPCPMIPEGGFPPATAAGSRGLILPLICSEACLERAVREHLKDFLPSSTPAETAESVQYVRSRLTVLPEKDGTGIWVSSTDESPRKAVAMAHACVRALEVDSLEASRRRLEGILASLDSAIQEGDRKAKRVEEELQELTAEIAGGGDRQEKALQEEVESLDRALSAARLESASLAVELDLLLERLERGEFGPLPALESTEAESANRELEKARRELDRLRAERPEDAPALAAASQLVEQLRRRRAAAMEEALRKSRFAPVRSLMDQIREKSIRREFLLSSARDLQIRLDKARQRLQEHREATPPETREQIRERSLRRRRLERERDRLEEFLGELRTRKGRIEAVRTALVSPVERTEISGAVALPGNPWRGVPWGVLGGILLGIPLAWILGRTTHVLRTEADVRRVVHLPLLGIVPRVRDASPALAETPPESELSESWQSIATTMEGLARRAEAKILLVTSPGPGEGKSTTAGNLAVALARSGATVLLVDADLRRPVQHQVFGVAEDWSRAGLSAFLQGTVESAEAVTVSTGIESLALLPAGPYPGPTAPLLRSKRLQELIAAVREKFDYVVMDGPPVSGSADALLLAPRADAVVLVLASGETRKDEVTVAKRLLRTSGARILGALLNKTPDHPGRGYYSYSPYSPAEAPG